MIRELISNKEIRTRINILFLLLILLGLLIYLFLLLTRPPRPVTPVRVKGITHLFSIYGSGRAPGDLFYHPDGVAVDKDGKIYATDTGNHRVMVFNKRGRFLFKFGKRGLGKGELMFPVGIAVAPNGNIYVTSMVASRLSIFNSRGKIVKEVIILDPPIRPLIVGKRLYITTAGQIWINNLKGEALKIWGIRGRGPRQFELPNGIAVSKDGTIYVSDTHNDRIQALDKRGNLLWIKGKPPESLRDPDRLFGLGMGMALDSKGRVYVVDAFHHALRVFDKKGKHLAELGSRGTSDGKFEYPATLAYIGGRTFAIADKYNNRVQVVMVTLPGQRPPVVTPVGVIPLWLLVAIGLVALLIIGGLLRRYLPRLRVPRRTAEPSEKPEGV